MLAIFHPAEGVEIHWQLLVHLIFLGLLPFTVYYFNKQWIWVPPKDSWKVQALPIGSMHLVFAGPVHWTGKKTEIELNPTAKDQTTGCGCTNSEFFRLPVATFVENRKTEKNRSRPVATGLSSRHVLDLTYTHFSLLVGPWIIKNGQELVEI